MKTFLRSLLLGACAGSALVAQQPPAGAPHPPAIQKMLDAPAWYLNYTVRLEANGSDGGSSGTHALRRVTSGRMMLGIRSGGPSLSIIANRISMAFTAPDQIDALVANYANWISGPIPEDENLPPAQRMTEAQADAHWHRVRQQNIEAHEQFSYSYDGPSHVGGTDRIQESGSGTVWHTGEPAFEIDAVNRKFKLLFSFGFADSPATINARTGTHETGIGTIHYNRQAIKTGLYPFEAIGSITPAISTPAAPFFEGTLPNSGNISYSSVHAIQLGPGRARGVRGTFSISFTLSPDPPEEVELIIEPPANYDKWQPVAKDDEKTTGDVVPIKVVLQKRGGGTPRLKPLRYNFFLKNTTREAGICLNWPPPPAVSSASTNDPPPFDLQFEQNKNPNLMVMGNDGQAAVDNVTSGALTSEVKVSSFDYGAYGEFEASAELENGQTVYGIVKNTNNQQQLKLPLCKDGSKIALAFLENLSHLPDDDDSESDPVGDRFTGDGMTLYEEYRGFMIGDKWMPANPRKKEVFVINELRGLPSVSQGIRLFESLTGFTVYDLLRDNQVQVDGQINYRRTAGAHIVEQHAIRIEPGELVALGNTIAQVTGKVGTPGTAKTVSIPPDLGLQRSAQYMAATLAHEMLHACNVYHHGEKDMQMWWSYRPPDNQFYESAVGFDPVQQTLVSLGSALPITVKREDGSVVLPSSFFQAGKTGGAVYLGLPHGQHSGNENCLMRYDCAFAYVAKRDPSIRYLSGRESTGLGLCTSPAGTGVNDPNRSNPESRYLAAATTQNGGPGVTGNRGDCVQQLRVSDLATEPQR